MRTIAVFTLSCLACAGSQKAPELEPPTTSGETASDESAEVDTSNLVRLYLLADVTTISPGQEFRVAARFDVEPTWHIYWTNPGESGLPTQVEFSAPPGFEVGPNRFPGPETFDGGDGTGAINYGYSELVLVSATLTAPDQLAANHELRVKGTWLACREMCVPGESEATIALGPATQQVPSAPANDAMFVAHEKTLPVQFDADRGVTRWIAEQNALEIKLTGVKKAEYFPSVAEQISLAGQLAIPTDDGVTLVLSYKKDAKGPIAARGVISTLAGVSPSFHQLNWKLAEEQQ